MKKLLLSVLLLFSLAACKSTKTMDQQQASWLDGGHSPLGDQTAAVNVVYFPFDSSALDHIAKGKLDEQAKLWHESKVKPSLVVEGHTDSVGDKEYNLALGNRRAHTAKKELEKHGVPADKVDVVSYGLERPAVMDNDALNRRAVTLAVK